jgi:hypothetical protein
MVFVLLVSVADFGALVVPTFCFEKEIVPGERPTGSIPAPERETDCGLFVALSVIVTLPLLGPRTEGVKTMLIVHFPFAGSDMEHVSVSV